MYHMHWTLDDVRKLTLPQFNWIVRELEEQKERERRAVRKR
jgi:hypothetical protein